jgi:EAL domain-containing protein (putative c-di-GMP-specific phosphodiesterase class I)
MQTEAPSMTVPPHARLVIPYLEHFPELDQPPQRIMIAPIPFQIGRESTADYVIHSQRVSKNHAQIIRSGDGFAIVDRDSTNGTFVNGHRIKEAQLQANDIIHISHKELRFRLEPVEHGAPSENGAPTVQGSHEFTDVIHEWEMLKEVLREQQVHAVFQPIVQMVTEEIVGFELLSRVTNRWLGASPMTTLNLANKFQIAPEVSRLFRSVGLQAAARIPGHLSFFVNLHPSEIFDFSVIDSLAETAAKFRQAGRQIVVEVHEDAIADTNMLCRLRQHLRQLGIGLAFDDFGAGQSRLAQLVEAAPDFVKLDMQLIRGIDQSPPRQDLVRALCDVATNLNVRMIAEGVETQSEADVCRELGCVYAQGYLFGHPSSVGTYLMANPTKTHQVVDSALQLRLRELVTP